MKIKKRNYKEEYKKFQSGGNARNTGRHSTDLIGRRVLMGMETELDASHKDGKIAGFESEGKNRGRREKSRLKKNK